MFCFAQKNNSQWRDNYESVEKNMGELLYTDEMVVWNAQNQPITNDTSLCGSDSLSDNMVANKVQLLHNQTISCDDFSIAEVYPDSLYTNDY